MPSWLQRYGALPRCVLWFAVGQFLINLINTAQFLLLNLFLRSHHLDDPAIAALTSQRFVGTFSGDSRRSMAARTLLALALGHRCGVVSADGIGFPGGCPARCDACGILVLFADGICRAGAERGEHAHGIAHGQCGEIKRGAEPDVRHLGGGQHLRRYAFQHPARHGTNRCFRLACGFG